MTIDDNSHLHSGRTAKARAYLEPSDVQTLETSAGSLRDRLLIRLLFHLGIRVSEALALRVDDIDFEQGTVVIQHLKHRGMRTPQGYQPSVSAIDAR